MNMYKTLLREGGDDVVLPTWTLQKSYPTYVHVFVSFRK